MCRMLKATLTPRESCWITGVRLTLYHRSWLVNLIFPPIQSSLRNRVLPPSSESSSMHQRPHHQANPLTKFRWIPRWITCELSSSVQLHVFTDASERAYGACLYVRSVSLSGEVHVHLLTAKSKVAPVKSTTIPRLELCAALLGSRLYMKVQNANVNNLQRFRRIECLKQHFWSRFSHEYILWLQQRTKWLRSSGELTEGTLVVIKDKSSPPLLWLLGRIVKVLPGRDGIARVADIRTRKGVIRRAFNTICPLPVATAVEDTSTGGVC
nr:uncharacterized protein LOC126054057 isoform X4 [Helicoverpa armigera]